MIYVDRMVGRLSQLMQNPDPSSTLGGRTEYSKSELVFVYSLRAGECEKNTSGRDLLESLGIESAIPLKCIMQSTTMLGESRWIKYYEIMPA